MSSAALMKYAMIAVVALAAVAAANRVKFTRDLLNG